MNNNDGFQVYVGDLDPSVTNIQLMQAFQGAYPSVFEGKVICDPVSRISKGYGFIKFGVKEESEKALQEMQGHILNGKPIKMNYASQRNRNQGGGQQQNQNPQNMEVPVARNNQYGGGMPQHMPPQMGHHQPPHHQQQYGSQ